ncbi:MAG: EAL domain-containing protein [Lachnospiraceae bacterium]|nr:EAL domain-containing protein [Lachnospiraceae bacterium]
MTGKGCSFLFLCLLCHTNISFHLLSDESITKHGTHCIINHIIGLAHAMGAKVVAEGVEEKEQLEFLQSVDCDMIQGYYFYKPMPAEEFVKLI